MLNKRVRNNKIFKKDFSFYKTSWKLIKYFENVKNAIKNFK